MTTVQVPTTNTEQANKLGSTKLVKISQTHQNIANRLGPFKDLTVLMSDRKQF